MQEKLNEGRYLCWIGEPACCNYKSSAFYVSNKGEDNCCMHTRGAAGLWHVDEGKKATLKQGPTHAQCRWEIPLPELWFPAKV